MTNERIVIISDDKEYYLQDAPAQSVRAYYTPGKATPASPIKLVDTLAENWPREFPIKVGNPLFDNADGIQHVRVTLVGRGSVCDVTIAPPVVLGSKVVTVVDPAGGIDSTHTVIETETQQNNGSQERGTGYNGIA